MDWMDNAACRKTDLTWFFGFDEKQIEQAKELCARCTVQLDCLVTAFERDEVGIWGGMTDAERKQLRKANRDTAKQSVADDSDEYVGGLLRLTCPSHGTQWTASTWSEHGADHEVLVCGCLIVNGEFVDGLEVSAA